MIGVTTDSLLLRRALLMSSPVSFHLAAAEPDAQNTGAGECRAEGDRGDVGHVGDRVGILLQQVQAQLNHLDREREAQTAAAIDDREHQCRERVRIMQAAYGMDGRHVSVEELEGSIVPLEMFVRYLRNKLP